MTASETASRAVGEATAVGATSLNAYAAWLAKHETKAARKRSPGQANVVASVEEEECEDQIHQEVEDPYLQWLRRKETKLPLVKVVVASPDRVDKAPVTESNSSSRHGSEDQNTTRAGDTGKTRKTATVAIQKSREVLNKGKKRLAASDFEGNEGGRTDKKAKRASIEVSPSTSSQHSSPSEDPKPTALPRTPSVKLPMLEEVRYWRDVDRFSFLS